MQKLMARSIGRTHSARIDTLPPLSLIRTHKLRGENYLAHVNGRSNETQPLSCCNC